MTLVGLNIMNIIHNLKLFTFNEEILLFSLGHEISRFCEIDPSECLKSGTSGGKNDRTNHIPNCTRVHDLK